MPNVTRWSARSQIYVNTLLETNQCSPHKYALAGWRDCGALHLYFACQQACLPVARKRNRNAISVGVTPTGGGHAATVRALTTTTTTTASSRHGSDAVRAQQETFAPAMMRIGHVGERGRIFCAANRSRQQQQPTLLSCVGSCVRCL